MNESEVIMTRLQEVLLALPGVKIRPQRDVPLFHVDPDDPAKLIRILNGKVERGNFCDGRFIADQ